MKPLAFLLTILSLAGCNSIDRLLGIESNPPAHTPTLYSVACCRDNDGHGHLTYPSFVPSQHTAFCEESRLANFNDTLIDGDIYLATDNDCGNALNKIGDQYYVGKNY